MNGLMIATTLLTILPEMLDHIEELKNAESSGEKLAAAKEMLFTTVTTANLFPGVPWAKIEPIATRLISMLVLANNRGKWKADAPAKTAPVKKGK